MGWNVLSSMSERAVLRGICEAELQFASSGRILTGRRDGNAVRILGKGVAHVEAVLTIRVAHAELLAAERLAGGIRNHGSHCANVLSTAVVVLVGASTIRVGFALGCADGQRVR